MKKVHPPSVPWTDHDHFLSVLQSDWYRVIAKLQSDISFITHDFFRSEGLKTMHLPMTTMGVSSPMGLGSDSTPVEIELLGIPTYLSDSQQFFLEYGCRLFDKGCFCLQPSHRGESPDKTHLSQFYHAEAEIHGSFDDAISLAERYIRALATELLAKHRAQIEAIAGDTRHIGKLITSSTPFHRISVTEAQKILASSEVAVHSDPQFRVISRKGERELIERFGGFVWLTELDHLSAPFYQAFNDSAHTSAKAADLLFGLGEVIGMGERHRTAADVRAALALHDVSEKGYEWYLRLREEYPLTTSGFGLGVERFLCWLLKHDDIRDCQLIPRVNGEVSVL